MVNKTVKLILSAVALALGVGTFVLQILGELEVETAIRLLSISVICLQSLNCKRDNR